MNTRKIAFLVSASLSVMASFSYAASIPLSASPQSKIWIEGKSTLHPFTIKASTFNLQMSFEAPPQEKTLMEILKAPSVHLMVTVPVKSLKSEFEVMDDNIQKR